MPLDDDAIEELALAPKKIVTDEGSVEERSVDELIKANEFLNNQTAATSGPFHGLRISRCKPGGAV